VESSLIRGRRGKFRKFISSSVD